jgi:N-acetylmuramic acid 6-phosphate etherase
LTERRNPRSSTIDTASSLEIVDLIGGEDATVPAAVATAREEIARVIDLIEAAFRAGGRLIYVGAGTAGRMGVIDAAECPPTFNTDQVVGVMAGGTAAVAGAREGSEDDAAAGAADIDRVAVGADDVVVGSAASGRTPYTIAAVQRAGQAGALTVGISSNLGAELSRHVDHAIEVATGPELLAGSTRLKAGTAQKIVLNTISTITMVRLGKTYGNLMVDVRATNAKLRDRARRMVAEATGAEAEAVERAIESSGGDVKVAIVMLLTGSDAGAARQRLDANGGVVRRAVSH